VVTISPINITAAILLCVQQEASAERVALAGRVRCAVAIVLGALVASAGAINLPSGSR
jgi:hypothetical protein